MTGRFPIAVHIMTLLYTEEGVLTSDIIAQSININPVLARKELSELIKHGLVLSREGKNGGYMLSRPAKNIFLSDIYHVVKSHAILGKSKNSPDPACKIGRQINTNLNDIYQDVEKAVEDTLNKTSLLDFCKKF